MQPNDREDLATKMEKMASLTEEHLETMGSRGRLVVKQLYETGVVRERYLELIASIIRRLHRKG